MTDDRILYEELSSYLSEYQPEDLNKLQFYDQEAPSLNSLYGIGGALEEALRERVWMKSGGYLVIQPYGGPHGDRREYREISGTKKAAGYVP